MPPLTLDGTNGVSAVQTGAVESSDLPAGSVIQVASETSFLSDGNSFSTTSGSFIKTPLEKQINLTSSSSSVLVLIDLGFVGAEGGSQDATQLAIGRDNTVLISNTTFGHFFESVSHPVRTPVSMQILDDSPGSLTPTYSVFAKCQTGGEVRIFENAPNTFTLIEIAG